MSEDEGSETLYLLPGFILLCQLLQLAGQPTDNMSQSFKCEDEWESLNSLHVLSLQCLVPLMVLLHLHRYLVDCRLKFPRHFLPPLFLLPRPLPALLLGHRELNQPGGGGLRG